MIQDLFMQFLIVLIPPVCFQLIMSETPYNSHGKIRVLSGLLYGATAILCIVFPVGDEGSAPWDFRFVTLVAASLYGGPVTLSVASVIMLLFQFYWDAGSFLYELAALLLYSAVPYALSSKAYRYSGKTRVLSVLGLCVLAFWIETAKIAVYSDAHGYSFLPYNQNALFLILLFVIILLGAFVNVLLIENAIERHYLRHEIQLSEKLKIVSQIAASVAHEVRNPLTVIRGFLQLMRNSLDEKNKGYMKMILSELDRAQLIINDYLNLAKPYPENAEIVDAAELLEHSIQMMSSYGVMHNVELYLETERDLWIKTEKTKFSQVLLNLIKNGIEAIDDGGRVDITAELRDQHIHITVADTGRGMSDEQLRQIGTPFFTTKENGTGLGLLVTIRMVEAMEGKISYTSEKGKGTRATVRLPAAQRPF